MAQNSGTSLPLRGTPGAITVKPIPDKDKKKAGPKRDEYGLIDTDLSPEEQAAAPARKTFDVAPPAAAQPEAPTLFDSVLSALDLNRVGADNTDRFAGRRSYTPTGRETIAADNAMVAPLSTGEMVSGALGILPGLSPVASRLMSRAAAMRSAAQVASDYRPTQAAGRSIESAMASQTGQGIETQFGEMLKRDAVIGARPEEIGNKTFNLLMQMGKAVDTTAKRSPNILDPSDTENIITGLLQILAGPGRGVVNVGKGAYGLVRRRLMGG